jgi:[citrate (pro-3S)-lyase] ligase
MSGAGLSFDEGADAVAVVEDMNGKPAASASLFGYVIRMVAVDPVHQESGLAAMAISALMETARMRGVTRLFLYTKPGTAPRFASLGFKNIAETGAAALLETGEPGISAYRRYLAENRRSGDGKIGCIAANCDPFTLGHRYLMDRASEACDHFYVIVAEEDKSRFSYPDRYEMVRLGTEDIGNMTLLRSGPYAVSDATFPTYFLKDRSERAAAAEQTRLDLALFLRLFVPALGINVRFVGTEPLSPVTNMYNEAMKEVLVPEGVEVAEIERAASASGDPISASAARAVLDSGDVSKLPSYLPAAVLNYMRERGII